MFGRARETGTALHQTRKSARLSVNPVKAASVSHLLSVFLSLCVASYFLSMSASVCLFLSAALFPLVPSVSVVCVCICLSVLIVSPFIFLHFFLLLLVYLYLSICLQLYVKLNTYLDFDSCILDFL